LRRITGRTSLNDIVDIERAHGVDEEVARKVRRVVATSSAKVDLELLEEIVAELVSNFARHSEGPLAALTMQWYPMLRQVRLAVGDCGVGIRKSLSTNRIHADLKSRPHYEAAWRAFQPGVTRTKEAGFGLPTVLDDIQQMKGYLTLATGNGYVRKQPLARPRWGVMAFELPGYR
jgi:K+-sensing histidine kinase KdpD